MKTTKSKFVVLLILTLPILFLTSCYELSDADWELVETAFENWAEENGLLENDQWQPDAVVVKAVEDTVKDLTNDEKTTQLDGLDVIREIEEADQLASEGISEWDKQKLREAENLRPGDWRIQEQKALVDFRGDTWKKSFDNSDDLVADQVRSGGDCVTLRTQQLEFRLNLLEDNIAACAARNGCDDGMMQTQIGRIMDELVYIREKNNSIFCDQIKYE